MRILELGLHGFGCFSGQVRIGPLPGRDDRRLVVLHGENEAGKSTVLHAIRWLLFGGPTGKAFAPEGDAARLDVSATVALERGTHTVLDLSRTRARGELRGVSRASTDEVREEWIHGMLGHPNRTVFETVFGFSLEGLAEGARTLAHDAVRGAMYGGLGGASRPDELRNALIEERETLFKERGRVQKVNALAHRVGALRAELKHLTLSKDALGRLETTVEAARAAVASAKGDLDAAQRRFTVVKAEEDALPVLRALDRAEAELAGLGVVPAVSDADETDALVERWAKAGDERARARTDRARRHAELVTHETTLLGLPADEGGLDADALYDRLQHALVARDEARATLLVAANARAEVLARAEAAVADRAGWSLDRLRAAPLEGAPRLAFERALAEREVEAERLRATLEEDEALAADIAELEALLARAPSPPDPAPLRALLPDLATHEPARRRLTVVREELAELFARRARLLARVGDATTLARIDDEEVAALVRVAEEQLSRASRLAERVEEREAELAEASRAAAVGAALAVPTEAEVEALRAARDEAVGGPLGELRRRIAAADGAVDRLRAHADVVSNRARAEARVGELRSALERLTEQRHALALDELATTARVRALTNGHLDRPLSLRGAVADARSLEAVETDLAAREREIARLEADLARMRGALEGHLPAGTLDPESAVRRQIEKSERLLAEREQWSAQIARQNARRAVLAARRASLPPPEQMLAAPLAALGLDPLPVHVARETVQALAELRRSVLEADRAHARAEVRLAENEQSLVTAIAAIPAAPADADPRTLLAKRTQRQKEREARLLVETARDRARAELAVVDDRHRLAEQALEDLRVLLGASDDDDAERILRLRTRAAALRAEIAEGQQKLAEIARRAPEPFVAEARALGEAGVKTELAVAARIVAEAEAAYGAAERAVGNAARERSEVDGGDRAAEQAAEIERVRAELTTHVERWCVLTLADRLLDGAIRRFERDHQPALLLRASTLFEAMTGGRYLRIVRPLGEQRVVVERRDGEKYEPERLSTGTREQMWLALRLAYVERYCAAAEPLPVVLDDVLVNFDERRTTATLRALAEVTAVTQVLLFTCHESLLETVRLSGVPAAVLRI
ncbi:MAG: AAA family ATPase [Myxococcales bacterium]|nr:AAA family ATPase [Myxococcales bacterium]